MADLRKLAQAMCSVDLAESHWTQELPRLPVPDLWLTVSRYLGSLKAVLEPSDEIETQESGLTSEQIHANRRQFARTDQLVKQFMLNEGPQLQRDLKEYANKCQNWATDYWLHDMYLSNPAPLPINSNPFFMFPRQRFATSEEMLMFATRVIQFSVDFKYRIDQQTLKQDVGSGHGKGKPLCMETYKNFFHSYRMAHEDMDRLLPQSRRSNHIVVASCNQFYILRLGQDPLDNPYRKEAGSEINEAIIFDQLLRIYRISRARAKKELLANGIATSTKQRIPKVGLFTSENRKTWARVHKKLTHCNGVSKSNGDNDSFSECNALNMNTESLRQIEACLFVMCLDSLVYKHPTSLAGLVSPKMNRKEATASVSVDTEADRKRRESNDETDVEAANIILTGGGSHLFTANRWFDKFLQIIVGRDGICGINIEHSASEGITVLRFLEEFLDFIRANPINKQASLQQQQPQQQQAAIIRDFTLADLVQPANHSQPNENKLHFSPKAKITNASLQPASLYSISSPAYVEPKSPSALLQESDQITPLNWILDDELQDALDEAENRANQSIANFSLHILEFTQFGRAFIKNQNLSPDAFIQLALQYTFFKIHGFLVSTYESASLRQFRLGRVDNIRANTCEAYQWIHSMLSCKKHIENQNQNQNQNKRSSPWTKAEPSFVTAITKQVEILRYTIHGGGPDNHMLALKQLAHIRYDDELPELFTDQSYKEFNNFRLSTSQLPNESGITVGYGSVTPDGYGCSYNPCEDRIVFCVSSFVDCPETDSAKFASTLKNSLEEMQELCLGRSRGQEMRIN